MATNTIGSGGDYATLALWEAARQSSTDATERAEILDGAYTASVTLSGWGSAAIEIVGQTSQDGDWTTGARLQAGGGVTLITPNVSNSLLIEDIVFETVSANFGARWVFSSNGNALNITVRRCLGRDVTDSGAASNAGFGCDGQANGNTFSWTFENCVFVNAQTQSFESGGIGYHDWTSSHNTTFSVTMRGCTLYQFGIYRLGASTSAFNFEGNGNLLVAPTTNNLFHNFGASGTGTVNSLRSITSEASHITDWGSITTTGTSTGVTFVTGTPASGQVGFTDISTDDYSLVDNANNLALGFVTSGTMPTDDILGTTRDSPPDAGAFEVVAAGGSTSGSGGSQVASQTGGTGTRGSTGSGGSQVAAQTGGAGTAFGATSGVGGSQVASQTGGTGVTGHPGSGASQVAAQTAGAGGLSGVASGAGGSQAAAQTAGSGVTGHTSSGGSQVAGQTGGTGVRGAVGSGGSQVAAQTGGVGSGSGASTSSGGSQVSAQTGGTGVRGSTGSGASQVGVGTAGEATGTIRGSGGSQIGVQTGGTAGTDALVGVGGSFAQAQTGGQGLVFASGAASIMPPVSQSDNPSPAAATVTIIERGFEADVEIRPQTRRVVPLRDAALDPRVLDGNFRILQEELDVPNSVDGPWIALAKRIGGAVFRVDLSKTVDTKLKHTMGRVPTSVFYSRATDGFPGEAVGNPNGGAIELDTMVLNTAPWTATEIALRGTRAANYIVVVV